MENAKKSESEMRTQFNQSIEQIKLALEVQIKERESRVPIYLFKNMKKLALIFAFSSHVFQSQISPSSLAKLAFLTKEKIQQVKNSQYVFQYLNRSLKRIGKGLNFSYQKLFESQKTVGLNLNTLEDNIWKYINKDWMAQLKPEINDEQKINTFVENLMKMNESTEPSNSGIRKNLITLYPSDCLSCIKKLPFEWKINFLKSHQQVSILTVQEAYHSGSWQRAIVATATKGEGYIFGGLMSDGRIDGINFGQEIFLNRFNQHLKKIIEGIQPKLQPDQFSIDYIPVVDNFFGQFNMMQKKYVIRVSVDVKDKSKIYYLQFDTNKKHQNNFLKQHVFYNENMQMLTGEHIYLKMLQKHQDRKTRRPPKHYKMQCQKIQQKIQFRSEEIVKIPEKFGEKPNKIYSKSSMIVLKKKAEGEKQLQKLKDLFAKNSYVFDVQPIYENIESDSGKLLYFFSHEKRFADMEACMFSRRNEFREIRFFQVKPLLMLKEARHLKEAAKLLLQLKKEVKMQISYFKKWHQIEGNQILRYVFVFEEVEQTILAFAHLEAKRIRTNFVSEVKLQNVKEEDIIPL